MLCWTCLFAEPRCIAVITTFACIVRHWGELKAVRVCGLRARNQDMKSLLHYCLSGTPRHP